MLTVDGESDIDCYYSRTLWDNIMAIATYKPNRWGVLTPMERQNLYAELEYDRMTRDIPTFKVGDVVETPFGLYEVRRLYDRGQGYVDHAWVSGWRYECVPLTNHLPGKRSSIYHMAFRTFRDDELVLWNPCGGMVETPTIVVVPPIVQPKLLMGNTMNTPLLTAWSSDVRVTCRDLMAYITTKTQRTQRRA